LRKQTRVFVVCIFIRFVVNTFILYCTTVDRGDTSQKFHSSVGEWPVKSGMRGSYSQNVVGYMWGHFLHKMFEI